MEQPPPMVDSPSDPTAPPSMSLVGRMVNVFVAPGEVFAQVRTARGSAANWLVPGILLALVGVVAAFVIFSQPAIVQQIQEQQTRAMDQMVKSGKMTQADADRALAIGEKFTGASMLKIFGSAGAVVISFGRIVWWALVLWLMANKFFKAPCTYGKALEVAGLTMVISIVGAILGVLLVVNFERLNAGPSLGLLIKDFDFNNRGHIFAGAANLFSLWQVSVLSVGLARLANTPLVKALCLVFGYWILQECLLIFVRLGQLAL